MEICGNPTQKKFRVNLVSGSVTRGGIINDLDKNVMDLVIMIIIMDCRHSVAIRPSRY